MVLHIFCFNFLHICFPSIAQSMSSFEMVWKAYLLFSRWVLAPFACLISRIFSISQQYFSFIINQWTVFLAITFIDIWSVIVRIRHQLAYAATHRYSTLNNNRWVLYYKKVGKYTQEFFKRRVKGNSPPARQLELVSRIIFFCLW